MKTARRTLLHVQVIPRLEDLITQWRSRRAITKGSVTPGRPAGTDGTCSPRRELARSVGSGTQQNEVLMLRRIGSIIALASGRAAAIGYPPRPGDYPLRAEKRLRVSRWSRAPPPQVKW